MSNPNITFRTDTTEVQKMLDYFKNSDWIRAEKNALKKAAREVRKYERKRLVSMFPNSTKRSPKYSDKISDAIRVGKDKTTAHNIFIKVHTMGSRKPSSGTFRARFYNNSKQGERTNKKDFTDSLGRHYKAGSRHYGVLKQIHYFDDNPNGIVEKSIDQDIKNAIEKINNRKYNK